MAVRIIAALVGIIIGVIVLIFDNLWVYVACEIALSVMAVWELTGAVRCAEHKALRWTCLVFSGLVPVLLIVEQARAFAVPIFGLFVFSLFMIMLIQHKKLGLEQIAVCGASAVLMPASLSCMVLLRYEVENGMLGVFLVLFLMFSAWFGDSGAYFVGTFLGKHKLCPEISPKKTVEGLIGGVITVGVVVFIECFIYNTFFATDGVFNYFVMIPLGMFACLAGVLGDLSASVVKRKFDVKDFGNIMPGHGGMLDRFDSILFVAPFVYSAFVYLGPIAVC